LKGIARVRPVAIIFDKENGGNDEKEFLAFFLFTDYIIFLGQTGLLAQAGRGVGRLGGVVLDEKDQPIAGVKVVISFVQEAAGGLQLETKTNKKESGLLSVLVPANGR